MNRQRNRQRKWTAALAAAALALAAAGAARANNLQITNVTVTPRDGSTAFVEFDISWQNSWRYTNINHDAAWVFFKAQPESQTWWTNVVLEYSGVNPTGCETGTGTAVELVAPSDKVGLFVRRAGEGYGSVAVTNVKVVWNLAASGLTTTSKVKMQALAAEMVYVAEGNFEAGDGQSDASQFTKTTITTSVANVTGGYPTGQTAPANATWPNGHAAFYCMKYEITQGQYKDFLNALASAQDTARYYSSSADRYTIAGSWPNHTASVPDRACNYLSWADVCAFADWAGLRPMTELEFEKACRGPLAAVAGEYAWGSTVITQLTAEAGDGTGTSTVSTVVGANCLWNNGVLGPCRVGIFATAGSTRAQAGASYWGIMELSGNVWERPVTIGHADGRNFTGLHGNGLLTSAGDADVGNWPAPSTASGAGYRGGAWKTADTTLRASDRSAAFSVVATRVNGIGGRAVRSAPSGVGP